MPDFEYFKPYEGDRPYIFISYAHADSEKVLPIISDMHRRGYNIWYDEGIEVGAEWQECIASHLMQAQLVVAFISNAYMRSDNCRREMHYAQTKKIKTINVFLEATELTPGMEMQIGNIFALMKYTFPSEEFFYEKLYSAPLLKSGNFCADIAEREEPKPAERKKEQKTAEKKPKKLTTKRIVRLSAALVVFGCLLAAFIVGYFTGFIERVLTPTQELSPISPDTELSFKEPLLEEAAREYAGKSSGTLTAADLRGLTALYICGESWSFDEVPADADTRGSITELSDLYNFPDLQTLYLQKQSFNSLETLPACGIETLDISDNRLASLDGIGKLPKLKALTADNCPLTSLGDLNTCLELQSASFIGASVSDFSVFKPLLKIKEIAFSNAALSDMRQVFDHSSLRKVSLYNCDLTGSFFGAFDRARAITELSLVNCTLDSSSRLDHWTGLTSIRLSGTRGIADWSELTLLTSLETVYIDEGLQSAFSGLGTDAGFEIVVD